MVQGNWDNLIGNAVVFWMVRGYNHWAPDHEVIAANFTISALTEDDKMVTATFPPVSYKLIDDLMHRLTGINCDIFNGGDIQFPRYLKDLTAFVQHEIDYYNDLIEAYTAKYKERFAFKPEFLSDADKIYQLEKLRQEIRFILENKEPTQKVEDLDNIEEKNTLKSEENDEEPFLGDDADEFGVSNVKGMRISFTNDNGKSEQERMLDASKKKVDLLTEQLYKIFNPEDLSNFQKLLIEPGTTADRITKLYTQKFLAIYNENYEDAADFSKEIINLQKRIDI